MLTGNTLFAGDSITVGLSPFVQVDGAKRTMAEVGRSSAGLVTALRGVSLATTKNLLVLIGTNDIGFVPPNTTIANILECWKLGKAAGARVIGMTIPPVKGWPPFAATMPAVEARRQAVNLGLGQAFAQGAADGLIDLSKLLADPADPQKLAASFDSGDHLHPRKDAMGSLLTQATGGLPPLPPPGVSPVPLAQVAPSTLPSSSSTLGLILLVGAGATLTYLLTRKR